VRVVCGGDLSITETDSKALNRLKGAQLRKIGYLLGNDPRMWRTHVPHFARTEAASVARGFNVAVYGTDEGVEYGLRIAPGTDISKLRFALEGAQDLHLDDSGNLVMSAGGNEMTMNKPAIYEEIADSGTGTGDTAVRRGRADRNRVPRGRLGRCVLRGQ
jgi:hypothetical protein